MNKIIIMVHAMNGKKEYCLRTKLISGNVSPTIKFPNQLATLIADIIIGLGPTSVSSKTKRNNYYFMHPN